MYVYREHELFRQVFTAMSTATRRNAYREEVHCDDHRAAMQGSEEVEKSAKCGKQRATPIAMETATHQTPVLVPSL